MPGFALRANWNNTGHMKALLCSKTLLENNKVHLKQ